MANQSQLHYFDIKNRTDLKKYADLLEERIKKVTEDKDYWIFSQRIREEFPNITLSTHDVGYIVLLGLVGTKDIIEFQSNQTPLRCCKKLEMKYKSSPTKFLTKEEDERLMNVLEFERTKFGVISKTHF